MRRPFTPFALACIGFLLDWSGPLPAAEETNRGGSLVLSPADYEPVAPALAPQSSLDFGFAVNPASSKLEPRVVVDGATTHWGVHDALTDWNVWCFGAVTIGTSAAITVSSSSNPEERAGDPIAILSRGDLMSSATWNLKGKGWKGGGPQQRGYGPGAGGVDYPAGHAILGFRGHMSPNEAGPIYNRGAPDGSLTSLFSVSSPLGSGGSGWVEAGSNGGGALQLTALGSLALAGLLDVSANPADYTSSTWGCGGSGGTVILATAQPFSDPRATVQAHGGDAFGRAGSGGRIAIYANFGQHRGTYRAREGDDPVRETEGIQDGTRFFAGPGGFPFPIESGTRTITLQGVVSDADGNYPTGEYDARLRFYDAPTGGGLLDESDLSVQVNRGFFSVEVAFNEELFRDHNLVYIEVWIDVNRDGLDSSDRFTERFKITSVPFADNANRLDGVR
jgi:hypothetical protein